MEKDIIYSTNPGTEKCTLNTKNEDHLIDKNSNNYLVISTKKMMVSLFIILPQSPASQVGHKGSSILSH